MAHANDQDLARVKALGPDLLGPQQRAGLSGLEIFRAMLHGELPTPPMMHTLGFFLAEVEAGRVVYRGTPTFGCCNSTGNAHGGLAATMLDSCMTTAVACALPAGKAATTAELKLNYLRPLNTDCGPVSAEGRVIHLGGRIATAEGRIVDAAGKLYAHGTTTCLVLDRD
ncbi:MAG: PaaI family thioesterase [Rubrivivax sp.]